MGLKDMVWDVVTDFPGEMDVGAVTSAVTERIQTMLNDTATRRAVFDIVTEENDDLSMMEVHQILDALVRVCSNK